MRGGCFFIYANSQSNQPRRLYLLSRDSHNLRKMDCANKRNQTIRNYKTMKINDYNDFIGTKRKHSANHGFDPLPIIAPLFEWQAHILKWAVQKGRAALFEDCGLGKTAQQLEWASQVLRKTGGSKLKKSYADQACGNLSNATAQGSLALV